MLLIIFICGYDKNYLFFNIVKIITIIKSMLVPVTTNNSSPDKFVCGL